MASVSQIQPKMDVATPSLPHHLVSQQEWTREVGQQGSCKTLGGKEVT